LKKGGPPEEKVQENHLLKAQKRDVIEKRWGP